MYCMYNNTVHRSSFIVHNTKFKLDTGFIANHCNIITRRFRPFFIRVSLAFSSSIFPKVFFAINFAPFIRQYPSIQVSRYPVHHTQVMGMLSSIVRSLESFAFAFYLSIQTLRICYTRNYAQVIGIHGAFTCRMLKNCRSDMNGISSRFYAKVMYVLFCFCSFFCFLCCCCCQYKVLT